MTFSRIAEPKRATSPSLYAPVLRFYAMEALGAFAAVLLLVGIFFYTHQRFTWGMRQNLTLASGLGAIYIVGALSAGPLSATLGGKKTFLCVQIILMALALLGLAFQRPLQLSITLLAYSAVSGGQWPILESMVSQAAMGEILSKRLAMYNVIWSAANALALAISGTIIQHWPGGIFIVSSACHLGAAVLMHRRRDESGAIGSGHIEPEPELLAVRKQALWLSRIALPSTYVVACSLNAMMPSLPVMQSISTQWETLLGSVWFASRCITFALLGVTAFWHTRPKLMLAAAILMLPAFLGVTVRPGFHFSSAHSSQTMDVLWMIVSQIFLGMAMGIIYSASLYFGMVLSDGSTEHGGYHEALIGVGSVLGPASAVAADMLYPGQIGFGIAAVASLIGLSVLAATGAILVSRLRR